MNTRAAINPTSGSVSSVRSVSTRGTLGAASNLSGRERSGLAVARLSAIRELKRLISGLGYGEKAAEALPVAETGLRPFVIFRSM